MENRNQIIKMTSSELGVLWSQYINDSLSQYILQYFIKDAEDKEIKEVLEVALKLSEKHLPIIKSFFQQENIPIPVGFTDQDVNLNAKPLFTDVYKIIYLQTMTIHGFTRYSGAVGSSLREDIMQYFINCTTETMDLYSRTTKVILDKGIGSKPPTFNHQPKVDFIEKQSFLTGWFGERRPINAVEISGTYLNLQKTMAKMVLELGFAQVAESREVREFMTRGRELCQKHFKMLSKMLEEDHLHVPSRFESEVTDSKTAPFSDKLMLFHINTLLSSAIGYYGEALAVSQRRDIAMTYTRMIAEIGVLAEDGMNLLIKNQWIEQPPSAIDHKKLTEEH